jgi:hypothetical protein
MNKKVIYGGNKYVLRPVWNEAMAVKARRE